MVKSYFGKNLTENENTLINDFIEVYTRKKSYVNGRSSVVLWRII